MAKVAIDLEGKDNASAAFRSASQRLTELRTQIDALKAKGPVNFTVVDTKNLNALTREANQLERAMKAVAKSTTGAELASPFQTANTAASGFNNTLGSIANQLGLGGLGGIAGAAGLAAIGVAAGKAALSLEIMREESAQLEARFVGFTGSTANANAAFEAFDRVLGNALTKDEKMATAAQLMGLGLAQTAEDAAVLTRQALILGIGMDTLTQALETGRVTGLVQYGISVSDVKVRATELQKAQAGLTDTEAKAIAIKEQLALKSQAVVDAGGQAVTAIKGLQNAWEDLKDAAADKVQLEVAIQGGTNVLNTISNILTGKQDDIANQAIAQGDVVRETNRLAEAQAKLAQIDQSQAFNADLVAAYNKEIADATAALNAAQVASAAAQTATAVFGATASGVTSDLDNMTSSLIGNVTWLKEFKAAADAANVATAKAATANTILNSGWGSPANMGAYALAMRPDTQAKAAQTYAEQQAAAEKRLADERAREAKTYATKAANAYESAMSAATSRIQGYLSQGIQAAIGLKDLRGGLFEPGKNGAFENIFRAMAIANNGADTDQERQWAQQLGLTPESAARIAADFQRGLFSPEVMGLIDVNALVNEAKMAELAEKSQAAFAQAIANKAGVKTNLVSSLFGFSSGGGGEGQATGAMAEKQVSDAMGQVATTIGDTVKGKDFAGRMIGYGETIWGNLGDGIVKAAKESDALKQAIDALVANALLRSGAGSGGSSTNGGVQGAARTQGVTG